MKVVHILDSLHVGGAQVLLVTLAEALRERHDMEIGVVSMRFEESVIRDELERLGVPVAVFPNRGLRDLEHLKNLTRFVREQGYEVVHTHLTYSNILGGLAGRRVGIPVVASLHSAGFDRPLGRGQLVNWIEAQVLRRVTGRRVAVGHVVADFHRRRLKSSAVEVIPNAVPVPAPVPAAEIRELRAEIAGDADRTLLMSLGRLTAYKGYPDLLSAFAQVAAERPEATLAIAGEGPQRALLEARIAELGLGGQARLLGMRRDVPRLLAASDLFVNASHLEGLPVAVLEAMAAGLGVVATTVGDVERVVVPGTGVLVPPRQVDRLAAAIREVLDAPERRRAMGEAALAHVRKEYGVETWIDRLAAVYESALGRRPPGATEAAA